MKSISFLPALALAVSLGACSSTENGTGTSTDSTAVTTDTTAAESANQVKKYGIKSGIITFENTQEVAGMTMNSKSIIYFDDYGMKECEEGYKDDKLEKVFFSDGKDLITLVPAEKTAYKAGPASRGTAYRFDWNELPQKDRDAGNAKKLPNENIAGKDCEVYSVTSEQMKSTTKFAGWNNITLLTELSTKDMKSISKAVKIEENVAVPAEKFTIPTDYKVQAY